MSDSEWHTVGGKHKKQSTTGSQTRGHPAGRGRTRGSTNRPSRPLTTARTNIPTRPRFTVTEGEWNSDSTPIKNILVINDFKPGETPVFDATRDFTLNTTYLPQLFTKMLETGATDDVGKGHLKQIEERQPFVALVELRIRANTFRFAIAFDSIRGQHYRLSSRPIKAETSATGRVSVLINAVKSVLSVKSGVTTPLDEYKIESKDSNERQIKQRVLIVVRDGFLVFFTENDYYLLTEGQNLVFEDKDCKVFWRRVFDTKLDNRKGLFLKENELNCAEEKVDGMSIYHGVVQRNTTTDGSYVVLGEGIAQLDMTEVQKLIEEKQKTKETEKEAKIPHKQKEASSSPKSHRSSGSDSEGDTESVVSAFDGQSWKTQTGGQPSGGTEEKGRRAKKNAKKKDKKGSGGAAKQKKRNGGKGPRGGKRQSNT